MSGDEIRERALEKGEPREGALRLEWWATLVGVSAAGAIAVIGLVW